MRDFYLVLLIPLLLVSLSGCVAAGAGAIAGKSVSTPSDEAINYVRTHERPAYIESAIERGDIVRGMSKEDVRFVQGDPKSVKHEDGQTIWYYGTVTQRWEVFFEDGKVVDHNQ